MKKALSFFLLIVLLLSMTSCFSTSTPDSSGNGTTPGGGDTPEPDLYGSFAGLNFDAQKVTFATCEDYRYEIFGEEEGLLLKEEVYKRNVRVQNRLNVTLAERTVHANDVAEYYTQISQLFRSGDLSFDVVSLPAGMAASQQAKGFLLNLREWVPYVKDSIGTAKYWDQEINNALTLMGKQFYAVSDINLSAMGNTYCLAANKSLLKEGGINYSDIYKSVRNGEWTWDAFYSMLADTAGNSDVCGLVAGQEWGTAQISTMGVWLLQKSGETHSATPFMFFADVLQKINGVISLDEYMLADSHSDAIQKFANNKALFTLITLTNLHSNQTLMHMERDYSILPLPKTDKDSPYSAGSSPDFSVLAVASHVFSNVTLQRIGATLDLMALESNLSLRETVIETVLKRNCTRDEASWEMIDTVLQGRKFDIALFYTYGEEELICTLPNQGGSVGIWNIPFVLAQHAEEAEEYWNATASRLRQKLQEHMDAYANS